jgi:hypothetical protein
MSKSHITALPPAAIRAILLLCGGDIADVAEADLDPVCADTAAALRLMVDDRCSPEWAAAYDACPPALQLAMAYTHFRALGGQ